MTTAQDLINQVAIGFQDKLDQMEAARQFGIFKANELLPALTNLESAAHNFIHVGGPNASDENDGREETPLASAAAVSARIKTGYNNRIVLMTELFEWDFFLDTRLFTTITVSKHLSVAAARLKFVNAVNANRIGGIFVRGNINVDIADVDIELDSDAAPSAVFSSYVSGACRTFMLNLNVSRTDRNTAQLFGNGHAGTLSAAFNSVTLNNMAGFLFVGVPAGHNPNDRFSLLSSLISA